MHMIQYRCSQRLAMSDPLGAAVIGAVSCPVWMLGTNSDALEEHLPS